MSRFCVSPAELEQTTGARLLNVISALQTKMFHHEGTKITKDPRGLFLEV